jgi:uncharacterized protein involved in type VI secretion and phage assembly
LSNDVSREFAQAEGLCAGDPRIKAGWTITIKNVGDRFSGKYFITSATHTYNAEGYETTFTISGRQPNTLSHLLDTGGGLDTGAGFVQGVAIAIVTNLNDPDNLGRVKVKYPWLGDDIESDWLRIASPAAGNDRGLFYLPEVNDEVLVAFEHGDVHRPYMIGVLWNSKDKPPMPNSTAVGGGKVNERIIKSRSGHMITLDDTSGSEKINIETQGGHTITLDDASGGEKVSVKDKTGSNKIEIDSVSNSMTISVGQNLTIEATTKIELKATQIAINGSAKVDIKGGMINLN